MPVSHPRRDGKEISGDTFPLSVSLSLVPPASPLLSLHLSPLFPQLSQENYNLTAHFNISASKWVWQALLCVVLYPLLLPVSLPPSIHPPTPLPLSPSPNLLVSLAYRSPRQVQLLPCDRRESERDGEKKTKTNQAQSEASLPGYQAVARWVSWHVRNHEPTMRRGIASPWCTPLMLRLRRAQAVLRSDRG